MNDRLNQLIQWLKEKHIDGAFLTSRSNIFYFTGFDCEAHERLLGLFVFPGDEPLLVSPAMDVHRARDAGWQGPVISYHDTENPWDLLQIALASRLNRPDPVLAVEKQHLSYDRAEALFRLFPSARLVSAEEKVNDIRLIKEDREIDRLREAAALADYGVKAGIDSLRTGITEIEVVARIEYELKKKGVQGMSFSTMVLFGEKTASPHGTPGSRALREGDLVLFDLGVVWDGYCSDITRTFAYRSITEEQIRIYDTVLRAQTAALDACRPGRRIADVDRTARKIIEEAGYGGYFPHRTGHGLGIEVHESPSLHDRNENLLREGMVFTVEPGIYIPGTGGVRIEDDVVITPEGPRTLTQFPKKLQVLT